ncbi:MAG: hypothetical protein AAF654_00545 [Myxococcota bacterium]
MNPTRNAILACFLSVGCSSNSPTCVFASDCPDGLVCRSDVCLPECSSTEDCTTSARCIAGACLELLESGVLRLDVARIVTVADRVRFSGDCDSSLDEVRVYDGDSTSTLSCATGRFAYVTEPRISTGEYPVDFSQAGGVVTGVFVRAVSGEVLTPPVNAMSQKFGDAVLASPTNIFVGDPASSSVSEGSGSVFVYERIGDFEWRYTEELKADSPLSEENFGEHLARTDDFLVVGADAFQSNGLRMPAVYVFSRGPSERFAIETSYLGAANSRYGNRIATDGVSIAISAFEERSMDPAGSSSVLTGALYVSRRDELGVTWSSFQRLTPATVDSGVRFGLRPEIDGDWLYAQSPGGSDVLFRFDSTQQQWVNSGVEVGLTGLLQFVRISDDDLLRCDRENQTLEIFRFSPSEWTGLLNFSRPLLCSAGHGSRFRAAVFGEGSTIFLFQKLDGGWTETGTVPAPKLGDIDEIRIDEDLLLIAYELDSRVYVLPFPSPYPDAEGR